MLSSPLFTVTGMVGDRHAVTLDDLVNRAVVDRDGRILIPMIDLLAAARVDVDADLLMVEFVDGASRAVRLAAILGADDTYLQLSVVRRRFSDDVTWSARLWSLHCGLSPKVASISATTFAAFVGPS